MQENEFEKKVASGAEIKLKPSANIWLRVKERIRTKRNANDLKLFKMLHVQACINIDAPQSLVMRLYMDYNNWHKLFPLTIRAVRCVKKENGAFTVEVDHKKEGFVINIVTVLSNEEIRLEEFKPKYNATFINRFQPTAEGTRYTVAADVSLKGIYKIASPFIKNMIRKRLIKLVLAPMKKFSEKTV